MLELVPLQDTYDKSFRFIAISIGPELSQHRCCVTTKGPNNNGRNKGQKLVSHFFEDRKFCRLLITIPLKMYSEIGQPNEFWSAKC